MRCIFCLNERPPGNEHIFAHAIGGTMRTDRVCELGSHRRSIVQLETRHRSRCSPRQSPTHHNTAVGTQASELFRKVPDAVDALLGRDGVLANDHSQKVHLVPNKTGQLEPRLLYNKKTIELPGDAKQHQIVIDAAGGAAEVRKIIVRELARAQRDNSAIKLPTDAEIDRIVERCVQGAQTIEHPEVFYRLKFDMASIRRGILKIAYELAFLWLGESYLDDPMAAILRSVVRDGADAKTLGIRGTIKLADEIESLRPWAADVNCHIAFSSIVDRQVVTITVKIFDTVSAVIVVSEQPDKYVCGQFDPKSIRLVHIDPVTGAQRVSSFIDECGRISSRMLNQGPGQPFTP